MQLVKRVSGLLGGSMWLASCAISAHAGFSEDTIFGWTFLIAGVSGPIAGIAVGLIWGNWFAFVMGAVAWLFIALAPDPSKELSRPLSYSLGRRRCARSVSRLEAGRVR